VGRDVPNPTSSGGVTDVINTCLTPLHLSGRLIASLNDDEWELAAGYQSAGITTFVPGSAATVEKLLEKIDGSYQFAKNTKLGVNLPDEGLKNVDDNERKGASIVFSGRDVTDTPSVVSRSNNSYAVSHSQDEVPWNRSDYNGSAHHRSSAGEREKSDAYIVSLDTVTLVTVCIVVATVLTATFIIALIVRLTCVKKKKDQCRRHAADLQDKECQHRRNIADMLQSPMDEMLYCSPPDAVDVDVEIIHDYTITSTGSGRGRGRRRESDETPEREEGGVDECYRDRFGQKNSEIDARNNGIGGDEVGGLLRVGSHGWSTSRINDERRTDSNGRRCGGRGHRLSACDGATLGGVSLGKAGQLKSSGRVNQGDYTAGPKRGVEIGTGQESAFLAPSGPEPVTCNGDSSYRVYHWED